MIDKSLYIPVTGKFHCIPKIDIRIIRNLRKSLLSRLVVASLGDAYLLAATFIMAVNRVGSTIRNICTECIINRSTFYAHYEDVYDLLSKIEPSIRMDMYESFHDTDASLEHFLSPKYFEIILVHMSKHRKFYCAYLESSGKPTIEDGSQKIKEYVLRPYFLKLGITSESRLNYHFTFFYFGFIAVVKQWLDNDCVEPPHELSRILWDSIAPIPKE